MAKNYESEITKFLNQYKSEHPETDEGQLKGRARLWDRYIDPELQEGYRAARVPQAPYVYYSND